MQATHENNLYAKREFQTVNGQTQQLQAVLHDVVVRLDAAEKKVQANIEVVDNLVKMTNERLADTTRRPPKRKLDCNYSRRK